MSLEFSPEPTNHRHPAAEARSVLIAADDVDAGGETDTRAGGAGLGARVLESSPPAVATGDYKADDPVAVLSEDADLDSEAGVVLPTGVEGPGRTWDEALSDASGDVRAWAAARWLTADRRLPAVPPAETLVPTRLALHRLAAYVIAPVRYQAVAKFGLRWTRDGFGTPFFAATTGPDEAEPADRQIRVVATGDSVFLVDQRCDEVRTSPVTTLAAAASFLGGEIDPDTAAEHDSPAVGDPDEPLAVDLSAARFLGAWFGMGFAGLEALRSRSTTVDPSRPQLWPGHFDPAIEAGTENTRASYGASPGDDGSDEPYLYVSLWWPDRLALDTDSEEGAAFWNATAFTGRILPLSDFPTDQDPAAVAAHFWSETATTLSESGLS